MLETLEALSGIPEIKWEHGDDLCDCSFQRIGFWTNPYMAKTLEVRMCCIWADIYKQSPEFVREYNAFTDYNNGDIPVTDPWEWNGDTEMPRSLWYRQLATKYGRPLSEIRDRMGDQQPPQGVPLPEPETVTVTEVGVPQMLDLFGELMVQLAKLKKEVADLKG